eukprot:CAMPEP_0201492094 /NCGR_PEP_ID=MMETSP0151_2-20130828/32075_1 /ASSEMBLY_ACC=CAM_ASM_000257 /TAXON_ID=200890 /ORGANISM="Paramoeba atlantica, Strain 621/1 / CCAP 1560/9" /LENGTH=408 /DNA_ID=CAMNT_0047878757 /DNA_START=88 /DNA_END=1312 /DNA_ORIENTATION=+
MADTWDKFPSLYFAASPEGDLPRSSLKKISHFSLAIIEFRENQFDGFDSGTWEWANGDEAAAQVRQCENLAAHFPDSSPPCLVYRNGMWASTMFPLQYSVLNSTSNPFFNQDESDFDCSGFIDYAMDMEDDPPNHLGIDCCLWDFRAPSAQKVFPEIVVRGVINESTVTKGLFVDNSQSVPCTIDEYTFLTRHQRKELMIDGMATYRASFQNLVDNDKYGILSTTNRFSTISTPLVPWEDECPLSEEYIISSLEGVPFARNFEFWMWQMGDTCVSQIENGILEAENGIPMIVHQGWFPDDRGCLDGCRSHQKHLIHFSQDEFLEFGMAAFLVASGEGSFFGFSNMQDPQDEYGLGGWADVSWDYFDQYDDIVSGKPLGPPLQDNGVFHRVFENGLVKVDCKRGRYDLF